jgi:dihydropyrimidinase
MRAGMALDLLIRDVRAVTPDGVVHADLEVADGRIASIAEVGEGGPADRTIEGGGREAFPGVIDPHVHFRGFPPMGFEGDGFVDVAEAAVCGGVTAFVGFVIAPPEMPAVEAVRGIVAQQASAPADYGLHYVLWPRTDRLDEIPALYTLGVRSFKLFFAYPERGLMFEGPLAIEAMVRIAAAGGLALVHAEDGHAIKWVEDRARQRLGSSATIRDYLNSRPLRLEAAGVELIALWASIAGCPVYVVHLSTAKALPTLGDLLGSGADITVETCPQYLFLNRGRLEPLGALAKFAPVGRTEEDNAALWESIGTGLISTIGSDHAGHVGRVKLEVAGEHGIFEAPFGIPGIETLFPLMYTHGVVGGRLTREQLAAITSANAARRFGWYPRKGAIRPGADADVFLVDAEEERTVRAADLRSRAGYSPYEGFRLRGWPSIVVRRGEVVFDGVEVQGRGGRFLETDPAAGSRGRRA